MAVFRLTQPRNELARGAPNVTYWNNGREVDTVTIQIKTVQFKLTVSELDFIYNEVAHARADRRTG